MCSQALARQIADAVAAEAKRVLEGKLEAVILYGSYARGDFDAESDIDIMVRIACAKEELRNYRYRFVPIASALSLEYGVTVSVTTVDAGTFYRYHRHLPYYENVEREGIKIA